MKLKLYLLTLVIFTISNSFGQTGTHLKFDGVNDHVALTNNFNLTNDFTFETWIKTGIDGIILYNIAAYDNSNLSVSNGKLRYSTGRHGYGGFILNSNLNVADNVWHHVAITMSLSNGLCKLYIDGVEDASASFGIYVVPLLNLSLGYGPALYFNGDMDEIRIWNVIRTASEINGAKGGEIQCNEPGLVGYYQFNKGINAGTNIGVTNLTDVSANGHYGTLTNFALTGTTSNWLSGSPITSLSSPPVVISPVFYAQNATAVALTATPGLNGVSLLWYANAIGGVGSTTLIPSTIALGLTTYYVSSVNANGCESEREKIVVNINAAATHLNFDGVNDNVQIPTGINISNSSFTIEFYAKRTLSNTNDYVFNQGSFFTNNNLHIGFRDNNNFLFAFYNNDLNISDVNYVSDNAWHHWTCVYNMSNGSREVYQDGVLVGSQTGVAPYTGNGALQIGSQQGFQHFYDGSLDEIRIWNRALPIAEIQNNMNCELPSPSTQTGLIAYYQFNQGLDAANNTSLTSLTDASTSANNGTLTNFALTGTTSNWLAGSTIVTGTNCAVLSSSSFDITSNINVYPNPTNGNVNIVVNNLTNVSVSVYDLNGRTILNKELSCNENSIDISNFQSGMYLFKIKSKEGETVKKVIKN